MGNLRRLKKKVQAPMAVIDAGMTVNDCKVFLGNINPKIAEAAAGSFKKMVARSMARSQCPNMYDILAASLIVRDRLDEGKPLWN